MKAAAQTVQRTAVRLLLIDEHDDLLLHHYLTVDTGEEFWCTPGGALDAGESHAQAAQRELLEEAGFTSAFALGPPLWWRRHVFRIGDGRVFEQDEHYYALRVQSFTPAPARLSEFEQASLVEQRWLGLSELRATHVPLNPPELPMLLERALE